MKTDPVNISQIQQCGESVKASFRGNASLTCAKKLFRFTFHLIPSVCRCNNFLWRVFAALELSEFRMMQQSQKLINFFDILSQISCFVLSLSPFVENLHKSNQNSCTMHNLCHYKFLQVYWNWRRFKCSPWFMDHFWLMARVQLTHLFCMWDRRKHALFNYSFNAMEGEARSWAGEKKKLFFDTNLSQFNLRPMVKKYTASTETERN